jgi:hypothetical protein
MHAHRHKHTHSLSHKKHLVYLALSFGVGLGRSWVEALLFKRVLSQTASNVLLVPFALRVREVVACKNPGY